MLNRELGDKLINREISREDFWQSYQKDNVISENYFMHLFQKAIEEHSEDVLFESYFISSFVKEQHITDDFMDSLVNDCLAGRWHQEHEELVHYYKGLFREKDIAVLIDLVHFQPDYLDWDDSRQLARKSIYAIEAIQTETAFSAIKELLKAEDETVLYYTEKVLKRNQKLT